MTSRLASLTFLLLGLLAGPAAAEPGWDMAGVKQITFHTRDGAAMPIGTVTFTKQDGGRYSFDVKIDYHRFQEFFLSMRQFKCVEGSVIECYVPYPYNNPRTVSATDLRWLEHDLLFFFKNPNDYGAKLENGLYYALTKTDKGLVGVPQAINLDKIASPPGNLKVPPFVAADRDEIPPGSRWIESLDIK